MNDLLNLIQLPRDEQQERGLLYTPREIAQQPETWRTTLDIFEREQERIRGFLDEAGVRGPVERRPVVFLVGAGTSNYIGQALELLLRQQWGCEVWACASTDLLPNMDQYVVPGQRYLWISFSRSGDSPEGVAVLERAAEHYPEISQLVVTCNPKARMIAACQKHARSCVVVLDDAVNDRSLVMTSSFTNMTVLGQCLAHAWSLEEYVPILQRLCAAGETILHDGDELAGKIAARRFGRACFVGAGPLAAIANESALKVLEMSAGRVKTMTETILGLRHGPMAILDKETLFLSLVSGEAQRQGYALDLLREIGTKHVAGERIAVGPASAAATIMPLCDVYLPIAADVADAYRGVVDVIFGQLLGLYTCMEHQLRPDAPSPDGVITRVVQAFSIYR